MPLRVGFSLTGIFAAARNDHIAMGGPARARRQRWAVAALRLSPRGADWARRYSRRAASIRRVSCRPLSLDAACFGVHAWRM
jgi:hypothetical protein